MDSSSPAGRDRPAARPNAGTFQVLYEVAVAASGVLEPERLASLAVERAQPLTGADASSLFWWVPERELLVPLAQHAAGAAFADRARGRGDGVVGLAFASGLAQSAQDWARWRDHSNGAAAEGVTSVLAVPLLVDGQPAGVLAVRRLFQPAGWNRHHVEVLSLLAGLVAPALAAAQRHADLAASEESFRAIYTDAQEQLSALVRELSVHRTAPAPGGEPVSMSESQALLELTTSDELSQRALAVRLRLDKSTVSRLAAQMEAQGWVQRTRDPADARLVRLRLTSRGRAVARHLAVERASRLQGVLRSIPDAERDSFLEALQVVVRGLHRASAQPD